MKEGETFKVLSGNFTIERKGGDNKRIKSIDIHPNLPWIAFGDYDGNLEILNY